MLDSSIRRCLATTRDIYTYLSFHRPGAKRRFKGVYGSYSEALAAVPPAALQGFNHQSVAQFFIDTHFVFNPSDYPILFWLSGILESGKTLFYFGGGVGQSFYLYKNFLSFPEGMRWVVHDLENLVESGKRVAQEKNAEQLEFASDFDQAKDAAVFLTTGALQYIEPDLPEVLTQLPKLPPHILVNRVPMYDGKTYLTVQHGEHSFVPYKIVNIDAFIRGMLKLNYEKVDQWYLPRSVHVPFHPECFVPAYRGFYFRLKERRYDS